MALSKVPLAVLNLVFMVYFQNALAGDIPEIRLVNDTFTKTEGI